MSTRLIAPLTHPLHAAVRVPGSKSLTNRALLAAALAEGVTTLTNALVSDDSRYVVEALERLGFDIGRDADETTLTVKGQGGRIPATGAELFVGNAGTAARFLTAMLTLGHGHYRLDGDARMRERPISDLLEALAQLGVQTDSPTGCPPVTVRAAGLPGGRATVAGNVSSQFLSGLLLVAPYAQAPVELVVTHELSSKPYVDITLALMADFGVTVERDGYKRFSVQPQRYQPRARYAIESDASAASYFFAAPAICGGTVRVQAISRRSTQGDLGFLDVLSAMGCTVAEGDGWIEVSGPPPGELKGIDVNLRDMPDVAQTLAALAPFANGPTAIRGIASARLKETDRVAALCTELARLGVSVAERLDGLTVQPCAALRPGVVKTYNDHRMAMAFALIGLRAGGIQIENPECVSKTFPAYFEELDKLRTASPEVGVAAPAIRRARPDDYDGLCALMREANALHSQRRPRIFQQPAGVIWEREVVLGLMQDENVALFVAEAEGRLLGFVHVLMKDPLPIPVMVPRRYALVQTIAVTPEARRRGVGRRLMDEAHAWAEARDAASVELIVFEFNESAMAFYRDLGYETLSRRLSKDLRGRP
jgi:3-phosphoshikimate 1-carboxyvinyltransferase